MSSGFVIPAASTRSGWSATMASALTDGYRLPTLGMAAASAGKSEKSSRPIKWSPTPMANKISVFDGASETTLAAGAAIVTSRPSESVNVIEAGVAVAADVAVGAVVAVARTPVAVGAVVGSTAVARFDSG